MAEIDTAEIRKYPGCPGCYMEILALCDALDEAREGLAFWVDEANKRGNVVIGLMDAEKRAEIAEAKLARVGALCAGLSPDWPINHSPTFLKIRDSLAGSDT